jgi:hypothetical protein
MVIGSSFDRSGPSAAVAAGLDVHTHQLGRCRRSGRQTVTTTFPRVWPAEPERRPHHVRLTGHDEAVATMCRGPAHLDENIASTRQRRPDLGRGEH